MADSAKRAAVTIDADLTLEQMESGEVTTTVTVSTASDGALQVSSSGKLPSVSLRQIGQAKDSLREFASVTGQAIRVDHNGRTLASLNPGPLRGPKSAGDSPGNDAKWTYHWWAMLKELLRIP
jgi:hypothetical protein